MSIVFSVIIVILFMLIQALLQLKPATFSLLYHNALAKYSIKKSDNLALNYILGSELFIVTLWLAMYYIFFSIFYLFPNFPTAILYWVIAGILAATAISFFCFYFKKSPSTTLFLSRRHAHSITARTASIKSPRDAFLLGFFINIPELIFTLPLYLLTAVLMQSTTVFPRAITVIALVITAVLPTFIILFAFHGSANLASITRTRVKLKPFLRIIVPLCYIITCAITIIGVLTW